MIDGLLGALIALFFVSALWAAGVISVGGPRRLARPRPRALDQIIALLRDSEPTDDPLTLLCSADVADEFWSLMRPQLLDKESGPRPDLRWLSGVQILLASEAPPGSWGLVRHDGCDGLDHEHCTLLGQCIPDQ